MISRIPYHVIPRISHHEHSNRDTGILPVRKPHKSNLHPFSHLAAPLARRCSALLLLALLLLSTGCHLSDSPAPPISNPTTNPTRLATTQRSYWTTQPAAVTVQDPS